MKKRKKEKTALQKAYAKQIARLKKGVKRYEKQGYSWRGSNPVPEIPKRVTKQALEKIRQMKPVELLNSAIYIDYETGEFYSALKRKEEVKQNGILKRKETLKNKQKETTEYYPTKSIIESIRERLATIPDVRHTASRKTGFMTIDTGTKRNALLSMFEDTLLETEMNGTYNDYITYLISKEEQIFSLIDVIIYESEQSIILSSFANLSIIINFGVSLTPLQASNLSDLTDYLNTYED